MQQSSMRFIRRLATMLAIMASTSLWLAANAAADELAGKTVKLVIAGSAGGSHDAYGRTLIRHLEKAHPDTTFIAQNNRKAGGLLAAKAIQEAKGDVITLGLFHPSLVYMQLLDQQEGAFDLTTFKWIASLSRDQRFYGVRKDFIDTTLEGAIAYDKQPLSGTSAAGARSDVDLLLASALTGLKTKVVYGFRSSAQRKAIIAGELDLIVGSVVANGKLLKSGDLLPILKISPEPYPGSFAAVPALRDAARDGAPADLVTLMETINDTGRLLVAAPDTKDADISALRSAVGEIFESADYRAENQKLGLFLEPTGGAVIEARMNDLLTGKPELKATLAKAVECGRQISEGEITACDFASW